MEIKDIHSLFLNCNTISTDTRNISKNDMFFALKGENFNGNEFAKKAISKGAKYVIIDEEKYNTSKHTILVKNTLNTLQKLATYHRNYLNTTIIALTGSNGKTTTKELINAALSKKYKTTATKGNLNNHIGVPLTLLSMTNQTEIGIVEMGANHKKEIAFLCEIAQPDYGYITNFGKAHLEGFGGVKGVIEGKSELYNYLIKNNNHIFLNADDAIQKEKLNSYIKKIGFSKTNPNYYQINLIENNTFMSLKVENIEIKSNLIGEYNFTNLCAAFIIAKYFNVPLKAIKEGIENYIPKNNRSQIINKKDNQIILDAYNANPTSMQAALHNLEKTTSTNKIAILGDMFELGNEANKEHQYISNLASSLNFKQILLVGENFYKTKNTKANTLQYKTFNELKNNFKFTTLNNSTILIKGSRGMALERILDYL